MAKFENPKTSHFEFMGVPGAILMPLGLPVATYGLYFMCNNEQGGCSPFVAPKLPELCSLYSFDALLVALAWFAFQAALYVLLPGPIHFGLPLRNGERLQYRCNGTSAFWISIVTVLLLHVTNVFGFSLLWVYANYVQLMTAAILISFALSIIVYLRGLRPNAMLAAGGNSGIAIYDFFIGHELNPRIGDFDIKFFCELRPGLIGWVVIDLAMLAQRYESGDGGMSAIVLVTLFQFWYVLDAFLSEPAILSTMDICMDGFGFMLAYGDLAWVPFTYSLQARFLADFPQHLSLLHICGILAVQLIGYYIFRGANGQKDQFKRDPTHPSVRHLDTIPTERGTKLLCSGWWGIARHINYFGDLLMALAWSLPCGFSSVIPYFYPIYFAVLLWHRDRRDDHKCQAKYGAAWEEYCKRVPFRIVPGLY